MVSSTALLSSVQMLMLCHCHKEFLKAGSAVFSS